MCYSNWAMPLLEDAFDHANASFQPLVVDLMQAPPRIPVADTAIEALDL